MPKPGFVRGGQWGVALGIVAAVLLMACAADADVVAVLSRPAPSPRTDSDIVLVNAGTGAVSQLSFDTTEDEIRPSVSSDGSRIAFERYDPSLGDWEMMVSDRHTGQTAPVLDASQTQSSDALNLSISPDGQTLLTSGGCQQFTSSIYFSPVTLWSLVNFPNGPFTQSMFQPQFSFPNQCWVNDPVASGSLIAFTIAAATNAPGSIVLGQLGGSAGPPLTSDDTASYEWPSFGSPAGVPTVLFEAISFDRAFVASRPALSVSGLAGSPQPVPGIGIDECGENGVDTLFRPTFTSDGRYIGWLCQRPSSGGDFLLFVWDTVTQTLLNPAGVDAGHVFPSVHAPGDFFGLGPYLYEITVFRGPGSISSSGTVHFALAASSFVGILVQRVVGHHRLFGRRVPTLRVVGRVPLGAFMRGNHRLRWNLTVSGRRLKRGTYQVTLRSLTRAKAIRDFGASRIIHVR